MNVCKIEGHSNLLSEGRDKQDLLKWHLIFKANSLALCYHTWIFHLSEKFAAGIINFENNLALIIQVNLFWKLDIIICIETWKGFAFCSPICFFLWSPIRETIHQVSTISRRFGGRRVGIESIMIKLSSCRRQVEQAAKSSGQWKFFKHCSKSCEIFIFMKICEFFLEISPKPLNDTKAEKV